MEANDDVAIYESRFLLGVFVAMGIVATLASIFTAGACMGYLFGVLGRPPTTTVDFVSAVFMLLMGVIGTVLFGVITVEAVRMLSRPRAPVIFLARNGFKDVRTSPDLIPWSAIRSLPNFRNSSVLMDLDPQFAETLRLKFVPRFSKAANRLLGYPGLYVSTFPLEDMSARKLLELMRGRIPNAQLFTA